MNTENFNHEAETQWQAMGFTEDQYDEIMFKVMQILKRTGDSKQSERAVACMKWALDKFETPELSSCAIYLMGQAMEKAQMMASMSEMMSSGRSGILDLLKKKMDDVADEKEVVDFPDEENMKGFMEEFQALIKEFNGEEASEFGEHEGMMAIKLDPGTKDEFHKRLTALKAKYSIESGESSMMMPFGGPIAEA